MKNSKQYPTASAQQAVILLSAFAEFISINNAMRKVLHPAASPDWYDFERSAILMHLINERVRAR